MKYDHLKLILEGKEKIFLFKKDEVHNKQELIILKFHKRDQGNVRVYSIIMY